MNLWHLCVSVCESCASLPNTRNQMRKWIVVSRTQIEIASHSCRQIHCKPGSYCIPVHDSRPKTRSYGIPTGTASEQMFAILQAIYAMLCKHMYSCGYKTTCKNSRYLPYRNIHFWNSFKKRRARNTGAAKCWQNSGGFEASFWSRKEKQNYRNKTWPNRALLWNGKMNRRIPDARIRPTLTVDFHLNFERVYFYLLELELAHSAVIQELYL